MGILLVFYMLDIPNSEEKLILGNIHNAQQVRVGEQFDVLMTRK